MAHLSWTNFFLVQTIIITLIYLLSLFCCVKFKKILTVDPEFWGCTIFGPKIVHLPQTIFFYWKIINICLIYLLAPFIVQNLEKILPADPELWGCAIFGPKMAHFPKWDFFEILTIKEYWNLIGREPFFGYNLRTRFFPSMQFLQNVNEP